MPVNPPHQYENCPSKYEIEGLKAREISQNGTLKDLAVASKEMSNDLARIAGATALVKWLLGMFIPISLSSVASLVLTLVKWKYGY